MASGNPASASTGTDINLGAQSFNTSAGAVNVGTTPPTGAPFNADATNYANVVLQAKGSDGLTATLAVSGGAFNIPLNAPTFNCVTKTADYTMTATDFAVQADSSSAGVIITLPLNPTNGRMVNVGKSNSGGNNVTIGRNGKKIQNASADISVPSTGYASYLLQYDSTAGSWWFR